MTQLHKATWKVWLLCSAALLPARASAHPAAAESPLFADSPCVVVVDKREQAHLDLSYSVPMDDTSIAAGDIPVSDAKTHQFFAVSGTLYQIGIDDIFVAWSDAEATGSVFPLWITHSDVQRAAAAVQMASGVTQDQTDLPADSVLETRPDLSAKWLRISADDARRPITAVQALNPVRWQLADVPAGVYTVTGYVFSPPYNAWAPRAGVVKLIDADHDPVAGAIAPVNEVVFAYQGRKIKGCLDVPPGTKLDAYYYVDERASEGWQPWLKDQTVESGEPSFCFHSDRAELAGSIRIRWDLHPPDAGPVTTLRSRDTFTWLPNRQGECQESDTHCCDFPASDPQAVAGSGGSASAQAAGSGGGAGSSGSSPASSTSAANSGGCGCHSAGGGGRGPVAWSALAWSVGIAVLVGLARRGRLRRRGARARYCGVPAKSSSATQV